MALTLITAPTVEPVTATEAKAHLRVDTTDDDTYITALIKAARQHGEDFTRRALILQTWELILDAWPSDDTIVIPLPPLRSIVSVKYKDSDGTESTLAASEYIVNTGEEPGKVVLGYGKTWPSDTLYPTRAITVRFKAGYAVSFTANATTDVLTATGHPYVDTDMLQLYNTGGALPAGLTADTDYYARDVSGNTLKLAATSGGTAIDITGAGTGIHFLGEVPMAIKQAIMILAAEMYEQREVSIIGSVVREALFAFRSLLWPYRCLRNF